jgi:hypothetical protein
MEQNYVPAICLSRACSSEYRVILSSRDIAVIVGVSRILRYPYRPCFIFVAQFVIISLTAPENWDARTRKHQEEVVNLHYYLHGHKYLLY